MSASLVGSEMCIRDRSHTTLRPKLGSKPVRWATLQRGRLPRESSRRPNVCLLYTSDAADDM
eukprot:1259662-Alexandrium_andersonii.AAC.1